METEKRNKFSEFNHRIITYFKRLLVVVVLLAILIIVFLVYANKSEGFRAGTPIKLSKKGILFKTYEGQMNLGGIMAKDDNVSSTIWDFTVKHSADSVVEKINEAIISGGRVKMLYEEKYITLPWWGDTKYFVYDVEHINTK